MSTLERLNRILRGGGSRDRGEAIPALRRHYEQAVNRSRQFRRHAEAAPQRSSRLALESLADDEESLARSVQSAVRELGGFAGDVPGAPEPPGALNHWGRLCLDLEAHQEALKQLLDSAAAWTDERPDTAQLLRTLARQEESHITRIRELISRSDPLALD